jgi:hypothetical protein
MHKIGFSRETGLTLVDLGAKDIGLSDQVHIAGGIVGGYFFEYVIKSDHAETTPDKVCTLEDERQKKEGGNAEVPPSNTRLTGLARSQFIAEFTSGYLSQGDNHILVSRLVIDEGFCPLEKLLDSL